MADVTRILAGRTPAGARDEELVVHQEWPVARRIAAAARGRARSTDFWGVAEDAVGDAPAAAA